MYILIDMENLDLHLENIAIDLSSPLNKHSEQSILEYYDLPQLVPVMACSPCLWKDMLEYLTR